MGNDGGSIPTRRELVHSPKRQKTHSELRASNAQTQSYAWTYCPLSKHALTTPIVSDATGQLYNKDSVLRWLLEQEGDGDGAKIGSLKDIVEVKFEIGEGSPGGEGEEKNRKEKFLCPVTKKELGAGTRSIYLVPCGHAFTESAVRETMNDEKEGKRICVVCEEEFAERDVIVINPVDEKDIKRLEERRLELEASGLTHSLKAAGKKRKKDKEGKSKNKKKVDAEEKNGDGIGNIKNAAAAAITSRVLEEEREKGKKRKVEMSDAVKKLYNKDSQTRVGGGDFLSSTVRR